MGQWDRETPHWEARFNDWEMACRVFPNMKVRQ